MKFDTSKKDEAVQGELYLSSLIALGVMVEIVRKYKLRTLNQNSYMHLLLNICANEMHESLDWFKLNMFKIYINRDLFITNYTNSKMEIDVKQIKSTADLTTEEMSIAVDRLKKFAFQKLDIILPDTEDNYGIRQAENHIERNRNGYKM